MRYQRWRCLRWYRGAKFKFQLQSQSPYACKFIGKCALQAELNTLALISYMSSCMSCITAHHEHVTASVP